MRKIIFTFICLGAVCCRSNTVDDRLLVAEVREFDSFLFEGNLSTTGTLALPESVIAFSGIDLIVDSLMVLRKYNQPTNLSIFDLHTGRISEHIAYTGRGPIEYLPYQFRSFGQHDGPCLYTFNYGQSALVLNIPASFRENRTVVEEQKNVEGLARRNNLDRPQNWGSVFYLGDGSVFVRYDHQQWVTDYTRVENGGIMINPDSVLNYPMGYAVHTPSGEETVIPFFNPRLSDEAKGKLFGDFTDGISQIKPDGTRIVDAMRMMDYINFIDPAGKSLIAVKLRGAPSFEDLIGGKQHDPAQKYMALAVSDDYVFSLIDQIDPKTFSMVNIEKPMNESRRIRIFDWQGTPLASLKPDHTISSIYFDDPTNRLYAVDSIEERIYIYDMTETLARLRPEN